MGRKVYRLTRVLTFRVLNLGVLFHLQEVCIRRGVGTAEAGQGANLDDATNLDLAVDV